MKKELNISLICLLILYLPIIAFPQQGTIQMSNGITVRVRTKVTPSDPAAGLGNIWSSNSGNIIHRVITDKINRIYFGYDLLVERLDELGKFKVTTKPLSKTPDAILNSSKTAAGSGKGVSVTSGSKNAVGGGKGVSVGSGGKSAVAISPDIGTRDLKNYTSRPLPNYPQNIIVEEGDTITLDLLENTSKNSKISDQITITGKSSNFGTYVSSGISSDDKPAKTFGIDDVIFRMEQPRISINDKEYKTRSTIAGNVVWIYIEGKGRFIFSIKPQPGYDFQQIGTIRNNNFSFKFKGEEYKFDSRSPILGLGGNWNLWVMFDPNYKTGYELTEKNPFVFGAAGTLQDVLQNR
ncbi:MAG: hypothetical protein KDB79_15120 [Acidobacteria bacterium]|nr:hypothetical protein [Acidobacteriota bacterium]